MYKNKQTNKKNQHSLQWYAADESETVWRYNRRPVGGTPALSPWSKYPFIANVSQLSLTFSFFFCSLTLPLSLFLFPPLTHSHHCSSLLSVCSSFSLLTPVFLFWWASIFSHLRSFFSEPHVYFGCLMFFLIHIFNQYLTLLCPLNSH